MAKEHTAGDSPQGRDANQFDLTGPIVVGYSSTSFSGRPRFSYKDGELEMEFGGDEITSTDSPIGELVTVTLRIVPDALVRTFTLVVPRVRVADTEGVSFDTIGFETIDRSSAHVAPPGPPGPLQAYAVHELSGNARALDF